MARVLSRIEEMEAELKGRTPGFEMAATALFMETICFLSRAFARQEGKLPSSLRISEVISHIERNYSESIRMKELTKIAGISENHLLRVFRQATGHTPIDYLVHLRIGRACGLLRQDLHTITDIAYKVGFNDSNYFARQFRSITGMSPREYRSKQTVSA
jgi:transcriptional regulator GlxA family with amidase domain